MKIERDGDSIVLDAPLVSAARAREVPGARHDARQRVWRYPLSWASCVTLRGVFGADLEIGPELAEWAFTEVERRVGPALSLRKET